jgi:two-component system NtrC family sensor kinase
MAHVSEMAWPMYSLRSQLILQIFLPLIVLATIVVWMTFQAVEGLVEHRLEKEIELVARAMRVPVEQALREADLARVEQTLDAVFDIDRVYGAYVFDAEGRRVATAGEVGPGWQEQAEAAELVAIGEELGRYADFSGEAVYSYFVPLTGPTGRIEGLLQVVRQESEIADRIDEIRQRGWWIWSAVVLLMLGVLIVGHRFAVVRHLERLLDSMGRVEAGEAGHRADISGPREVSILAAGLNRMLDSIAEMQRELEAQRRERMAMTERLHQQENLAALGRFSSGVAHELGAPLSVIDGDARRLLAVEGLDDDARRRLERMRRQVQRTRQLIRQLMEFVRSDRREHVPVPVQRLLRQVAGSTAPQTEALGIELELAPSEPDLSVNGFEIRLEHAVLNLVRNAIQAAKTRVRLSAEQVEDRLHIVIEDDGPGVPEALRESIFEPFHSSREDGQGTGLGLAIVRSVANEHDARIEVGRSEALGGSRFELIFKVGQ